MELREWLFINRLTVTEFAKRIQTSRNYMEMIKNKRKIPSLHLSKAIESETEGQVTVKELRGK
jgi:DNA-binding transcriptional regulator YdaS (Cro superfamily)